MSTDDSKPPLIMYVIYDHPKDFPTHYVCRRWFVMPGEEQPQVERAMWASNVTLAGIRSRIPEGLVCLSRSDGDDPVILETWL